MAGLLLVLGTVSLSGCAAQDLAPTSQQEDRGLGIVQGTAGARQLLQPDPIRPSGVPSLAGQVRALEGGAYVVQDDDGHEYRVPHDENTRIDRPAHVGDRILVLFDEAGRAERIWNVDAREDLR
jgi:hypothetical protein